MGLPNIGRMIVRYSKDFANIGGFVAEPFGQIVRDITFAGATMTATITAPFLYGMSKAINIAGQFESTIGELQAVISAGDRTHEIFDEKNAKILNDGLRRVARESQFTASQIAAASVTIARAGVGTDDVQQLINATEASQSLALATRSNIESAASYVVDIGRVFGTDFSSVEDLNHVADVLAVTTARTNTSLDELFQAFKRAAPVADAFGLSLEETAAVAGVSANLGFKGSIASTSFMQGMLRLGAATGRAKEILDEHGIAIDLTKNGMLGTIEQLQNANLSIEDLARVMGLRATPLFVQFVQEHGGVNESLASMTELLDELTDEQFGTMAGAKQMGDIVKDTYEGVMAKLRSNVEDLAIALGQSGSLDLFLDMINFFVGKVVELVNFIDSSEGFVQAAVKFGLFLAAIGPLMVIVGEAMSLLTVLSFGFKTLFLGLVPLSLPMLFLIKVWSISLPLKDSISEFIFALRWRTAVFIEGIRLRFDSIFGDHAAGLGSLRRFNQLARKVGLGIAVILHALTDVINMFFDSAIPMALLNLHNDIAGRRFKEPEFEFEIPGRSITDKIVIAMAGFGKKLVHEMRLLKNKGDFWFSKPWGSDEPRIMNLIARYQEEISTFFKAMRKAAESFFGKWILLYKLVRETIGKISFDWKGSLADIEGAIAESFGDISFDRILNSAIGFGEAFFVILNSVVDGVSKIIGPLIEALILRFFVMLRFWLDNGPAIAEFFGLVLPPLTDALLHIVQFILPILTSIIEDLAPPLGEILQDLSEIIQYVSMNADIQGLVDAVTFYVEWHIVQIKILAQIARDTGLIELILELAAIVGKTEVPIRRLLAAIIGSDTFRKIGELIFSVLDHVLAMFEDVIDIISSVLEGDFGGAIEATLHLLWETTGGAVWLVIGGVGQVLNIIWTGAWEAIGAAFEFLWNWIKREVIEVASAIFESFPGWLQDALTSAWDWLGGIFSAAYNGAMKILQPIIDLIKAAMSGSFWDDIKGGIEDFVGDARRGDYPWENLRGFASGGIITRPTFALVGEDGPELILPHYYPGRMADLLRQAGVLSWLARHGMLSRAGFASGPISIEQEYWIDGISAEEFLETAEKYEMLVG